MALFKCKMCGGELNITDGANVINCEYCGTVQTVPTGNDEEKSSLFNRANDLRMKCEFDKASGIYESIITRYPNESEGYWGLVLCKFGIEYVDDPSTGKKIPTCHRTNPASVMEDSDFERAYENADSIAREVYRNEAKAIDKLQQEIISVVEKEEPYDVFICYKETDDGTKEQTEDSRIAQDIYTALLERGYKVFFARQTLKAKAGTEYEPYIYAALNSSKVMLAIGTKYIYYDAVWVKNEWGRFLRMMANDPSKHLIPCFKNLDAYDIPKEFKNLQALDISDTMFSENLMRNIERFIPKSKPEPQAEIVRETVVKEVSGNNSASQAAPLLERAFIFLADKNWQSANEYCEKVLDIEPKNTRAYLGKLMARYHVQSESELETLNRPFDDDNNYTKILQFGDDELKSRLSGYLDKINNRRMEEEREKEEDRCRKKYEEATALFKVARNEDSFYKAADMFRAISGYKDSKELATECIKKAAHYKSLSAKYHSLYPLANSRQEYTNQRDYFLKMYQSSDSPSVGGIIARIVGMLISFIILTKVLPAFIEADDEARFSMLFFLSISVVALAVFISSLIQCISLKFKRRSYLEQAEAARAILEKINSYPSFESFVATEERKES